MVINQVPPSNQNDKFSQSNQSDQSCEVKPTETSDQIETVETIDQVEIIETIGQNPPSCQTPPNIAMMPPGSEEWLPLLFAVTGILMAIAEVLRETSGFIRTWRNNDRDS